MPTLSTYAQEQVDCRYMLRHRGDDGGTECDGRLGAMAKRWCRLCDEPVQVQGEPYTGTAVHAATGDEKGPDGHLAVPTDTDPALAAIARRVEADYPEFEIGARFGFFRAVCHGSVTPAPVEADTEDELRRGLDARRNIAQAGVSTPQS